MWDSKAWQRFGVLGLTVALIAPAAASTPGAQAKSAFKGCADKKVHFKIEDGEGGKIPYTTTVKTISVKNTSCQTAYKYFSDSYNGKNVDKQGYVDGFKCKSADFKAPLGYIPTICTKGGETIKYAAQGG